ncbi:MAG TPA: hypothetical protein VM509_05000 [Planctomycetota bacterium]|nr:hypothetical protein [Planctomycetota bacterium]
MKFATTLAIEAEVTLLSTEEGGRRTALVLRWPDMRYRPHLVVGDIGQRKAVVAPDGVVRERYVGVAFRSVNVVMPPGSHARLWMDVMLLDSPHEDLQPGATFTVREGPEVVGFGTVLRRVDEKEA